MIDTVLASQESALNKQQGSSVLRKLMFYYKKKDNKWRK